MVRLFQIALALAAGAYFAPVASNPLQDVESTIASALHGELAANDWGEGTTYR